MQHKGLTNAFDIFLYKSTVINHDFLAIFEERELLRFDIAQTGICSKERRRQ